jgi:NAD(P)H-nitrite reductase large subunit
MTFSDSTSIDVDMLVISAGIKPRDELARPPVWILAQGRY